MTQDIGATLTGQALVSDQAPAGLDPSGFDPSRVEEIHSALAWCLHQAESIMGVSAGCASTHGDPGGGLEMVNGMASDIAINLQMIASAMSAGTAETAQQAQGEARQRDPQGDAQAHAATPSKDTQGHD